MLITIGERRRSLMPIYDGRVAGGANAELPDWPSPRSFGLAVLIPPTFPCPVTRLSVLAPASQDK